MKNSRCFGGTISKQWQALRVILMYFVFIISLLHVTKSELYAPHDEDLHEDSDENAVHNNEHGSQDEFTTRKHDSECSSLSTLATQTVEAALQRINRFDEFGLDDDSLGSVPLTDGNLKGFEHLVNKVPIETTCTEYEILIETVLSLDHVRMAFDWKSPSREHNGFIWAAADNIKTDLTALLSSTTGRTPSLRIIQMKVRKMQNFHAGNKGPNVFDTFGASHQSKMFKTIYIRSLEKALRQALTKEFQQEMDQVWFRTRWENEIGDIELEEPVSYRSRKEDVSDDVGIENKAASHAGESVADKNQFFYNPYPVFLPPYSPFPYPYYPPLGYAHKLLYPYLYSFPTPYGFPNPLPIPYHNTHPYLDEYPPYDEYDLFANAASDDSNPYFDPKSIPDSWLT